MNNYRKLISLLFAITLTSCGNTTSTTSSSKTKEDVLVDDSELVQYDELRDTYDNAMPVPSVFATDAPDPFIYRYDGVYYLYMTTSGGKIRCYTSDDMLNWKPAVGGPSDGVCYDYTSDPHHPDDATPYAPEVMYLNGKFYLVTSPLGKGHYILEADAPYGPFETITDNLEKSIDGSFFIDSNEDIYFYTAAAGPIAMYQLNDDMTFVENDNGSLFHSTILEANLGAWDEGPFMLQRDGAYYLSWCGTHYLSDSYRVDYCYAKPESDISKSSAFKRIDSLLLSTDESFKGLGHSCTVLGPDMDSEYIVYHELETNRRNLCFSRLSFDGSKMIVNDLKRDNNFVPALPEFSSYGFDGFEAKGNYYLSDAMNEEDQFSAEFNVTGEGKMYFSFVDEKNYSYIEYLNNLITVNTVENGTSRQVAKIPLIKEYDIEVNHTFRISYRDGLYNLYFDQIEKAYDMTANFKPGKIGFASDNDFVDVGYCALSFVGKGGSDQKEYNTKRILANAYDDRLSYLRSGSELTEVTSTTDFVVTDSHNLNIVNNGDRATYRIYCQNSNTYKLYMRLPASNINKSFGIRLDDGETRSITITSDKPRYKTADVLVELGDFDIGEGQHSLSIYNTGDNISFNELELVEVNEQTGVDESFDASTDLNQFYTKNEFTLSNDGLATSNDHLNHITTKEDYFNVSVSSNFQLNNFGDNGYVGLMVNVANNSHAPYEDGEYRNGNNDITYQGLLFSVDMNGKIIVKNVDYNFTKTIAIGEYALTPGQEYEFKVTQDSNHFSFLINDEIVLSFYANVSRMYGQAGFVSYKTSTLIDSLSVH